jgi:hypothetical protein
MQYLSLTKLAINMEAAWRSAQYMIGGKFSDMCVHSTPLSPHLHTVSVLTQTMPCYGITLIHETEKVHERVGDQRRVEEWLISLYTQYLCGACFFRVEGFSCK